MTLEVHCYRKLIELETVTVYDDIQNLTIHQPHKDILMANEFTKGAIIPIQKADGERLGVMTVYFEERSYDVKIYIPFIEKIVDLIVLAHSYEKKQQQIYKLAYIDKQTGMANRHGFIQQLEELGELGGAVYLIEPSEFSRIVELYGRDTGEALMKQIYERITEKCGDVQVVGRFASSSLIIYWEYRVAEMPPIERLLKCIVEFPFVVEGKSLYITLKSGGAARWTGEIVTRRNSSRRKCLIRGKKSFWYICKVLYARKRCPTGKGIVYFTSLNRGNSK